MSNIRNRCRFFNGLQSQDCEMGINYDTFEGSFNKRLPCLIDDTTNKCEKISLYTQEELDEQNKKIDALTGAIKSGLSPCCNVPFDIRQVITSGRFKNHGPRYCSKCGKLIYQV